MINYQLFPRSHGVDSPIKSIIRCFEKNEEVIDSTIHTLSSNEVLEIVRRDLEDLGFAVEKGKTKDKKIGVPVLFGRNNTIDKFFDADALLTNLLI